MNKICILLMVMFCISIIGCKESTVVPLPQLTLTVSSQKLQYGDSVTIKWEALNASTIETNFNTKELSGSMTINLYESQSFLVEAFNSEGASVQRCIEIEVGPNPLDPNVILTTHKWTHVSMELYLGQIEDGSDSWYTCELLYNEYWTFDIDGHRTVYMPDGTRVGGGYWFTWTLLEDNKILFLNNDRKLPVLFLDSTKLVLLSCISQQYYRETYIASPRDAH